MEHCPKCGIEFETRSAILDMGQSEGLLKLPSIPPRVSCPNCRTQFRAQDMRYFGVITSGQLRIGIAIFAIAIFASSFFILFWQDPDW